MDQIYHGCMTKSVLGTNRLVGSGKICLASTEKCFWKNPRDIKNRKFKTRSHTKTEPTVSIKRLRHVYATEEMDQSLGLVQQQRTINLIVGYCFFMMLFIVNNGNILSDGTNERRYLQRKYNDL